MVRFFNEARAIESLRDNVSDALSAYGEVIDNSLQAGAANIRIRFQRGGATASARVSEVAFGDDGHGMSPDTLHNCLTIGWSSRYNDRSGIGRFGVGMTLGAIHECRRVQIWSKESGRRWYSTVMDLDDIEQKGLDEVPEPVAVEAPANYRDLIGADSGTLVVWSKYDRSYTSAQNVIDDFRIWCGRTYRYYLWGDVPKQPHPVAITIDSQAVYAIDPLYARTDRTRFPQDPVATVYPDWTLRYPVDHGLGRHGEDAPIRIRMSVLPEQWRMVRGDGGSQHANERHIFMNEGISILRNYREVFYGEIPNWKARGKGDEAKADGWPKFEDFDRWWGCEIHFEPLLDRSFQVKNIKRGATPVHDLKNVIKKTIAPTRKKIVEDLRLKWDEVKRLKAEAEMAAGGNDLLPRAPEHKLAEKTAEQVGGPKSRIDEGKELDREAVDHASRYKDRYNDEQRAALAALFQAQPFTIMDNEWKGPGFFEASFLGGKAVVDYNKHHEFFRRLDELVAELNSGEGSVIELALEIKVMIDLLIIAFAKAESQHEGDEQVSVSYLLDSVRQQWGLYLQNYVRERRKAAGGHHG